MLGIFVVLRWNRGKYPRKYQIQDTRHQTWPTFEVHIKYILLVFALNTPIKTISFAVCDTLDELISRQTLLGQKLTSGNYLRCNRRIKPDRKPKPIPTQCYYPLGYLGKEVSVTTANVRLLIECWLYWFWFILLCDWSRLLKQTLQPIRRIT